LLTMEKGKDNDSILLGRRIRALRKAKGWTQQKLGNRADIDYKFLSEIERGNMNPSFKILVKIASALEVELPEMLRFDQEIEDPKEIDARIKKILKILPTDALKNILLMLRVFYPSR
jgi:transcriptional regulator with XRE-family HTH domain